VYNLRRIIDSREEQMSELEAYAVKGTVDSREQSSEYKYLLFISTIIFIIATLIHYASGKYVSSAHTANVPDLILDHIGPVNVGFFYVYGYIILFSALFTYPGVFHIRTFHVVITQFSLLIVLRAVFVALTHLGTPPDAIPVTFPWIFRGLSFENDMFFSGHTAIPFLGFLLFKGPIRYFFLGGSIFMGAVVLLIHVHYSIDVLAAFFMTYCSYKMGSFLINKAEPFIINRLRR
jgi:hypothetical protein